MEYPEHNGVNFTKTLHQRAKGPTLPELNRRPTDAPYVVVVTGAGKGIGYGICISYVQAGVTGIVISSRTQSDLDKLSVELQSIKPKLDILAKTCDSSKPEEVRALAEETKKKFKGHLDVVIANAGLISNYVKDAEGQDHLPEGIIEDDDFARITTINYLGSYYTAKYFTPLLISASNKSEVKAFVMTSSLASQQGDSRFVPVAYNVSKIAINRMIEHMANDHGKDGLLTYAVHPGAVVTPSTEGHHKTAKGAAWEAALQTDISLPGGFLTWLTKQRREYLSGRFLSAHWDVNELDSMQQEIVDKDKLKFRMVV